jgi:hypothetical protein
MTIEVLTRKYLTEDKYVDIYPLNRIIYILCLICNELTLHSPMAHRGLNDYIDVCLICNCYSRLIAPDKPIHKTEREEKR